MSDNAASLRHKIGSAGELKSVARTMKALAASSIGQYERSVLALDDYYRTVELGLGVCFRERGSLLHLRSSQPKTHAIGAVVFGSDQGLVGQFNETIADYAIAALAKPPVNSTAVPTGEKLIWAVGERVHARLTDAGVTPQGVFPVPTSVQAIAPLIARILVSCEASQNEIAELHLFYNRPASGSVYEPARQRLLPLDEVWLRGLTELGWPTAMLPEVVGDQTLTVGSLIREYLFVSLFRACSESLASENASRLAAMQRAEKNIDELLVQLNGSFHRLRQSVIDEELFDVVSGFEAMRTD